MKSHEELRDSQKKAVEEIKAMKKCLFTAPMGAGKTVVTLSCIKEWLYTGSAKRVLIIAPLRVAQTVWAEECKQWEHLSSIGPVKALGTKLERIKALRSQATVTIINKDNVKWLADGYKKWPFDTVVIDESSTIKNPASKIFKALKKASTYIERVVLLSGTPAPNSYADLWSQIYLIDGGERLGKNITSFRSTYMEQKPYDMYTWYMKKGADKEIDHKVKSVCLNAEVPKVGSQVINTTVKLTAHIQKMYKNVEKDFILELGAGTVTAVNSAVLVGKLLQICNGNVYDDNKKSMFLHDHKLVALGELVKENPTENVLVGYNYRSDLEAIKNRFPQSEVLSNDNIGRWNRGEIRMLLASPQSAGHGLNLQFGGSILVWYGLTWSLERYKQFNARLARTGQKRQVRIVQIMAEDTIEDRVLAVLMKKDESQEGFLQSLRCIMNE